MHKGNPPLWADFFMIHQLLATKSRMTQAWTKAGIRIPVTVLSAKDCVVVGQTAKQDRLLVGAGKKKLKNMKKPVRSTIAKAGFSFGIRQMKEIRVDGDEKQNLAVGATILPSQVFKIGDIVKVTGTSKGKGFTGVVKRYGFHGGPRTHGQSDRERAPGSIGAGTTPGRVYKNKRMAGRAGNETVTVLGLTVVSINDASGEILLKGIVPGTRNSMVTITRTGEGKFDGLLEVKAAATAPVSEPVAEAEEKTE